MNTKNLRRLGIGAGIVGLLLFSLTGFVCARSSSLLDARIETDIATPLPAADLARGEHLVRDVLVCTSCHGDDLGGAIVSEDGAMGRIVASNLTRGAGGGPLTAAQWEHAMRFGLGRDGRPLVIMPSDQYTAMSAEDLASVVAYLDTIPPVDRELAPTSLGPVGRTLVATGALPLPAYTVERTRAESHPTPAATAEYGAYVVRVSACAGCHGADFGGHEVNPNEPIAPDLTTSGASGWSRDELAHALRDGVRPDGRHLDDFMPYRVYGGLTDLEVDAIYAFLREQPAAHPE